MSKQQQHESSKKEVYTGAYQWSEDCFVRVPMGTPGVKFKIKKNILKKIRAVKQSFQSDDFIIDT